MKQKRNAERSRGPGVDERQMPRVPITWADGNPICLSRSVPPLVRTVVREFGSRWTPGGRLIYVTDGAREWAHLDESLLSGLELAVETHRKMPDLVVYHKEKNRLFLIEAVTSHGPVDPKRRSELKKLFRGSKAGLVFVTAFLDRHTMTEYLGDISWETEVWVADAPTHLIHFNGERFLGPYEPFASSSSTS